MAEIKSVFSYKSYKSYLKILIEGPQNWGMLSKLSEAAQCQKSYLSKAVHKEVHITPEQAYRISQFMRHNELEEDYFSTLVEKERSGDIGHRNKLTEKLNRLKRESEISAKGASKKNVSEDFGKLSYYTNLDWMLIHYLTSIHRLRSVEKLAAYLKMDLKSVENILKELIQLGLVKKEGTHYTFQSGDEHLGENHPLLPIFHRLIREKAMTTRNDTTTSVNFSALQTVSTRDVEKLKDLLLKTIESFHKIARPSDPEELVAISIDYFLPCGK